ncbi:unnamed protein product [Protopolystoma xenopodis]|uniref:Uncharacterized protein n=1 Tax=Protopolystoma xenopodis TaxID=117903 RepID=A0A3S5AE66_9PLAT|nr:unnamed protein product [Protopolystoma xenopodis]
MIFFRSGHHFLYGSCATHFCLTKTAPRGHLASHSDSDSDAETGDSVSTISVPGGSGGRTSNLVATGSNVLSSLVEFGSNLFRPDLRKASTRSKRFTAAGGGGSGSLVVLAGTGGPGSGVQLSGLGGAPGSLPVGFGSTGVPGLSPEEAAAAALEAAIERELDSASLVVARCIAAIEAQSGGLSTHVSPPQSSVIH